MTKRLADSQIEEYTTEGVKYRTLQIFDNELLTYSDSGRALSEGTPLFSRASISHNCAVGHYCGGSDRSFSLDFLYSVTLIRLDGSRSDGCFASFAEALENIEKAAGLSTPVAPEKLKAFEDLCLAAEGRHKGLKAYRKSKNAS